MKFVLLLFLFVPESARDADETVIWEYVKYEGIWKYSHSLILNKNGYASEVQGWHRK